MNMLDPRTLDRIAALIVDFDGPLERHGWELEGLLQRAGWSPLPLYDGTPRVRWLAEALADRAADHVDLERLLCRICDPLEYDGGMTDAAAVRDQLNQILQFERLAVTYVDDRPVLGELGGDGVVRLTAPEDIERRLRSLISSEAVVDVLLARATQSAAAAKAGAHLLAVIGIGSFVEGLLFSVLIERFPELATSGFPTPGGKAVPAERVGLHQLIALAHQRGIIQHDAMNFMEPVRNYRNFIHPRHQLENDFSPDQDTVSLCWGPVHAVLNDLESM